MNNLPAMNLTQLNEDEIQSTEGGLILARVSLSLTVDAINWAYTELKNGIADGYYNK